MGAAYEIAELWRYPIKSMGGERIEAAKVGPGGSEGDRRWAVRNNESGKIISAKRPTPYGQLLHWTARTHDGEVEVTGPDGAEYRAGDEALDRAVSDALGEQVSVVEVVVGAEETYDTEWPEIPGTTLSDTEAELPIAMLTEKRSFVDLAALHVVTRGSMDRLGTLAGGAKIGVERFRPNIVLDGAATDSFVDLGWKEVAATAGDARLWIADAAPRCVMTTLPQGQYEQAKGILAALAANARKTSEYGTYACFGTYAEVTAPGSISVGDSFVLEG